MEVEILSKELIRPLSPTPDSLGPLPLSFLDQIVPHVRLPIIFFYPNKSNSNTSEICTRLKKSLSEILATYYPVAGRVNNHSYIDCNDEGVLFVEAKVNDQLSDILRDRIPSNTNCFIPPRLDEHDDLATYIQITFLSCSGIVLAYGISHKVGDALSLVNFVNQWAAAARGNAEMISIPPFGSSTLFPLLNMSRFVVKAKSETEKTVTRLFLFDGSAIKSLKEKHKAGTSRAISRALAVGSFLCSRYMVKTQVRGKKYRVLQSVNLRTRMNPPLPILTFGNYPIAEVVAEGKVYEEDNDWFEAAKKMADSTRNLNADGITELQNEDGQTGFLKKLFLEPFGEENTVSFVLSIHRGFPFDEADFGWGKPTWIGTTPLAEKNVAFLVPSHDGSGLEAWVNLKEEDMAKFETDNKLLQYVKSYPRSRL